jgi:hypothetical protein
VRDALVEVVAVAVVVAATIASMRERVAWGSAR